MAITTTRTQYRILSLWITALLLFLAAANLRAYPSEKPPNPGALIIVDFTGTGSGTGSGETPAVYLFYNKTLDHIITACGQSTAAVVEDGAGREILPGAWHFLSFFLSLLNLHITLTYNIF